MTFAVAMPKLGMTMTEGAVVEWRVAPGDRVEKGQTVVIIESEKAEAEVEAPAGGVLRHVYVPAGTTVPCGTLLAALTANPDDEFDATAFQGTASGAKRGTERGAPAEVRRAAAVERGPRVNAPITPAARKRAAELGVDVAAVRGSGPGGRITREDVEVFASASGARIAVEPGVALEVPSAGSGDPVLLLPGFGTDAAVFAPQSRALAARYRVRAINPRGVGASDAPEAERYDVSTSADDVAAVVDQPTHVVGASLGAAVAIELALRHPDRVRSLVLITPFARASARLLSVIDSWCRSAREVSPETLARSLLPWFFSEAFLADEPLRERAVRGLAETARRVPAATLTRTASGLRAWSGTREGDLGRLSVPVLVIGAGADLLTPKPEAVAAAIPNAERFVVPDAGHAVGIEAADAVTDAIRIWLGRC